MTTPVKDSHPNRSQVSGICKVSENLNPNLSSPLQKSTKSPAIKSAKAKKSAPRYQDRVASSPPNRIQERKFLVAKKKSKRPIPEVTCKCKEKIGNLAKCPCIAYENLRASQEGFFRDCNESKNEKRAETNEEEEKEKEKEEDPKIEIIPRMMDVCEGKSVDGYGFPSDELHVQDRDEFGLSNEVGSSKMKKIRTKLLEDAMNSIPEPGSGRVKHLVNAFERLLSIPKGKEGENQEETKKVMNWALPGLQIKAAESEMSSISSSSLDPSFVSKNFDRDLGLYSSIDSSDGSISSRTSGGGRRSRRNSSDSLGRITGMKWKKQLKVTRQQPFKLRTEQRGRLKEEEFVKKVQEMMVDEEKQRIPIAQGLPWTTDEPECLVKPLVKEITKPVDVMLHSDVRAVERAEFDQIVAEKITSFEEYKLEIERQRKLEEEEEIRRLRKELVPRAQPMPYFDRPFIPKRSFKHPTIPREPKFHIPQHKKIKCMSWNDLKIYNQN